jgi:hypothetical protein
MLHVAIQRREWTVGDLLDKDVLCRCSIRPIPPFDRVEPGDTVFLKWTGGPIIALAKVRRSASLEYSDIEEVRELCKGYSLYELEDVKGVHPPIVPKARSMGSGWIILNTPEKERMWLG